MAAPMFNVYIGSETGLLKGINVVKSFWRNLNEIGKPDKSNEIKSLTWNDDLQSEICVGFRDKHVGLFDVSNQCFTSKLLFDGGTGNLKTVFKRDNVTITALDTGLVHIWEGNEIMRSINTVTKAGNLHCMVHSDIESNIFGTGGKESNLKLWDINDPEKPVFIAKNVKNDWLNLEVPIWITGIEFLADKKIVTSTGYHQVRIYDPSAQRRPVLDMIWDENPITAMTLYRDNQVVVGNTKGNMALLDIRKGKLVHQFKGFAGSIRSVKCHPTQPMVATCGLDRYLRVHDINSREMVHKLYMKSRLNCLLLTKQEWGESLDDVEQSRTSEVVDEGNELEDDAEAEEDEALWNQMELVKTRTVKRKAVEEHKAVKLQKVSQKAKSGKRQSKKSAKVK